MVTLFQDKGLNNIFYTYTKLVYVQLYIHIFHYGNDKKK